MESLNLPAINLKSQVSAVALQYKNVFKKIKTDTGPHPHPPYIPMLKVASHQEKKWWIIYHKSTRLGPINAAGHYL